MAATTAETEADQRLQSRLAERVLDPTRFNRRVPSSFYEKEEELGPLPEGWEKAQKGRQTYFVKYVPCRVPVCKRIRWMASTNRLTGSERVARRVALYQPHHKGDDVGRSADLQHP